MRDVPRPLLRGKDGQERKTRTVGNGWRRAVYVPDQRLCATHRKGEGGCQKSNRAESYRCWRLPDHKTGAAQPSWLGAPPPNPISRERRRGHREGMRNRETKPDLVHDNKIKREVHSTMGNGMWKSLTGYPRLGPLHRLALHATYAAHRSTDTLALLLRRSTYAKHTCLHLGYDDWVCMPTAVDVGSYRLADLAPSRSTQRHEDLRLLWLWLLWNRGDSCCCCDKISLS
ncbi:uncharacterized protein LY79DRAFT_190997 [Colletotrichum navitas]|uniref:Uncharacterized protein n=1 Tax=Colletotrichum navitas TaxID=681940 RepID=A0AAD8PZW7_9PEZI|nr:uncharacterized protein LY79DRAFT_190997 [Colletotrichum navitas]KAK1593213.1 hypothetical protein LY79DRAFT_190997 [Colletotrichum navitas]